MRSIIIFILLILSIISGAQEAPKYEFRGVWIATVNNIDWPSKTGLSENEQKQEAVEMLDMLKENGMNAVIMQIRPTADAFYRSNLEPWSRYLTGTQGGDPGYDPLEFWIEECHSRNMEFHAWLNPFRIAQNASDPLAVTHIAFQHPEWVVEYGGKLYFNPGIPEARDFVIKVVQDIVTRYDIDAIHFDDYFYPYPVAGEAFPDMTTFNQYRGSFAADQLEDWRRDNVNTTIQVLSEMIKEIKPWVKFGISPFGVWRNKSDDPRGSNTSAGTTCYDDLYADILTWMEEGWIDYVTPQIYWEIGHPAADYIELCNWWNDHKYNTALYIGHALYKSDENSTIEKWREADQMPQQVELTRQINGIDGSVFYSASHFKRNLMGFQDSLQNNLYATQAIIPPIAMMASTEPEIPYRVRKSGKKIKWKENDADDEMNRPISYIIYKNNIGEILNMDSASSIYLVTRSTKTKVIRENENPQKYEFRVTALNRFNMESEPSDPVILKW